MGANLWCQNDIALPTDIPTGKPYTLYWVWDWPTEPGVDPNLPKGKAELYTTCIEIDVIAKPGSKRRVKARQAPSPPPSPASQSALDHLNSAAIPAYVSSLTASPVPAGASQAVAAPDSPPSPYGSSLTASPAPAGSSASLESTITPSVSSSVVANPANPAPQVVDSNSMTNAGEASYIENAVSAAIVAEAPKVPLTVTVDIVESVISPMATGAVGAAAATQPATAQASNPVASPAYVAPASVPAASPASMAPTATQVASPASAPSPSTASTSTPAQAPANAVSSMPPESLEINPPILSAPPSTSPTVSLQGLSGTATPVVASPAATSVLAAGASKNPVIASGPATNSKAPVIASGSSQNGTAAKGQRGCTATTCKSKRQSKIFGK